MFMRSLVVTAALAVLAASACFEPNTTPNDGGGAGGGGGASGNCITDIISAGYMAPPAPPCSSCRGLSGTSEEAACMRIIDCLQPVWPCDGICLLDCENQAGTSSVPRNCAEALVTARCS
jgi:hypothetical protein